MKKFTHLKGIKHKWCGGIHQKFVPISGWDKNKRKSDGLQTQCRECINRWRLGRKEIHTKRFLKEAKQNALLMIHFVWNASNKIVKNMMEAALIMFPALKVLVMTIPKKGKTYHRQIEANLKVFADRRYILKFAVPEGLKLFGGLTEDMVFRYPQKLYRNVPATRNFLGPLCHILADDDPGEWNNIQEKYLPQWGIVYRIPCPDGPLACKVHEIQMAPDVSYVYSAIKMMIGTSAGLTLGGNNLTRRDTNPYDTEQGRRTHHSLLETTQSPVAINSVPKGMVYQYKQTPQVKHKFHEDNMIRILELLKYGRKFVSEVMRNVRMSYAVKPQNKYKKKKEIEEINKIYPGMMNIQNALLKRYKTMTCAVPLNATINVPAHLIITAK